MADVKKTGLRARLREVERQWAEGADASRSPSPRLPQDSPGAAPASGKSVADTGKGVADRGVRSGVGFDAGAWLMTVGVAAAATYGWMNRGEGHITAESGLGYWLGVAGGVMMLLLLLYPLRKKYRSWRILGSVPAWFRLHMILGVLGPTLILFHCNFRLGSTNSALALISMLIVAFSGLVGRYLYRRIHLGLYGERLKIREILADAQALRDAVSRSVANAPGVLAEMQGYERRAIDHPETLRGSLLGAVTVAFSSGRSRRRAARAVAAAIKAEAGAGRWSRALRRSRLAEARHRLDLYFALVNKSARLAVWERLFALWSRLHLPLFLVLILTTAMHILAVHLY